MGKHTPFSSPPPGWTEQSGGVTAEELDETLKELDRPAINTQTASYTLVAADASKVVEMNVGSANDLTVPANASVAFSVGTVINVIQYGAGQTTIVADTGVTIRTAETLLLRAQYSGASLYKRGTNEWVLTGDLEAA